MGGLHTCYPFLLDLKAVEAFTLAVAAILGPLSDLVMRGRRSVTRCKTSLHVLRTTESYKNETWLRTTRSQFAFLKTP
jgi:hypothetical protein